VTAYEEERPLSPKESLELIRRERAAVQRRLGGNPLLYYGPWGLVWLVGYGMFFLRYGFDDRPLIPFPSFLPGVVLGGLIAFAIAVTLYAGFRSSRGIAGASDERGTYYGIAWFIAFMMMGVLGARLGEHLPEPEAALYWTATSTAILTVLYMAGAAVWRDRMMFGLACWIGVLNVVGVIGGIGWHTLLVSLGGGGGLIVAGVLQFRRLRKAPS